MYFSVLVIQLLILTIKICTTGAVPHAKVKCLDLNVVNFITFNFVYYFILKTIRMRLSFN